jgi:hypothetical protein
VNAKTKKESKKWMHTHSPNKLKMFTQTLSACQKADGNSFLGQERSTDGGIYATRDHNNIRSVLRNTIKTTSGHSEQNAGNAAIWGTRSAPP